MPRRHTLGESKFRARDQRQTPKHRDHENLAHRLDRVEAVLLEIQQTIENNAKRLNALQAQLDHLGARIRPT